MPDAPADSAAPCLGESARTNGLLIPGRIREVVSGAPPLPPPPPPPPPYYQPPTQPQPYPPHGYQPQAYPPQAWQGPSAPTAKRKRGPLYWIAVVIGIIVLVVVILVVAALFYAVSTTATITAVNTTSNDDACGTDGQSFFGFTSSGGSFQETIFVNGGIFLSCKFTR